ncbi:isochorismatase family protein [Methanococcoides methylutens]|uniref:isochorismatase family protein n=1 Tax=Methanococcoides methylutens TaxID=2226 RepID=UPI0040442FF5
MTKVIGNNTAFILVDAQNFVLHENGFQNYGGVWKFAQERDMINRTVKALDKARAADIPIIYVRMDQRPQVLPEVGFWKRPGN